MQSLISNFEQLIFYNSLYHKVIQTNAVFRIELFSILNKTYVKRISKTKCLIQMFIILVFKLRCLHLISLYVGKSIKRELKYYTK